MSTVDLAPTMLELAGGPAPEAMQGRSFRELLTAPESYAGREYVFSERNWHDCDEHQRAVRTARFKLIRTDAYTALPLCTAADIGGEPVVPRAPGPRQGGPAHARRSGGCSRRRARGSSCTTWRATRGSSATWPTIPAYARRVRGACRRCCRRGWSIGDFPAAYRVRDDNTDRITGVPFRPRSRRSAIRTPPPGERWGRQGPT